VQIVELRGNVDTRLRKRAEGVCDAVLLAAAGLARLGMGVAGGTPLDPELFVPAVGQGALALEARAADAEVRELLAVLDDEIAAGTVAAERAFLRGLEGDCVTPIAGHAEIDGPAMRLVGLVATPDGREVLRDSVTGSRERPEDLGHLLALRLRALGAGEILAKVREVDR
jgi:hydroxymethylbilane synthase